MTHNEYREILSHMEDMLFKGGYHVVEAQCREILRELPEQKTDGVDWNETLVIRARTLRFLSWAIREVGQLDEALLLAEESLVAATEANSMIDKANATRTVAWTYTRMQNYPLGLEYTQRALRLYEEAGDKNGMSKSYNNLGNIYCDGLLDYSQALKEYTHAISLAEEVNDKTDISITTRNIGNVYRSLGNWDKALEYYTKALALVEELGYKNKIALYRLDIGFVYVAISEFNKALEYFGASLAVSEENGDKLHRNNVLLGIGEVYRESGSFDRALEYYSQALAGFEELSDKLHIASIIGNFGIVYSTPTYEGYDAGKAEEYLLKSLALFEEVGAKLFLIELHKYCSDFYKLEKRWEEFAKHYQKYHELKDELQSEVAKKAAQQFEHQRQIAEREKEIAIAKAKAEAEMNATTTLLHKVLPPSIATRLIKGETIADYFENVSILFADIVGFTPIASKMPARKVLAFLNFVFGEFDRIIEKHGCEKIKTIGDGYMAIAGAPIICEDHAERIARAAIEMMGDIQLPEDIRASLPKGAIFNIRIGINIGPAFGGIVGENRFVYDIYSDAVNTAARMESHGEPNKIHVSEEFAFHLQNRMDMTGDDLGGIVFVERDEIEIKGKGWMKTYFMEAIS